MYNFGKKHLFHATDPQADMSRGQFFEEREKYTPVHIQIKKQ